MEYSPNINDYENIYFLEIKCELLVAIERLDLTKSVFYDFNEGLTTKFVHFRLYQLYLKLGEMGYL